VLASKAGEVYLVECKWRSDKANVDDIDSLRSRLRRTNGGVVGILVSFNGFSGSSELSAAGRFETLADLLWRKKDALLTDGRLILEEPFARGSRSSSIY
jgi:hypothetical protein